MSVRRRKINGRWVYQARVAVKGQRKSTIRPTREEARDAEAELRRALREEVAWTERHGQQPATIDALLDAYAENLRLRGKGRETLITTRSLKSAIAACCPELLRLPVSRLDAAALFRFKEARVHQGRRVTTINRNLSALLAAVRLVRPEMRAPKGLFGTAPTRVRWLAPEEELLVLDTLPLPFRHIAKLAALTLMRLSEIRRLRIDQVRLADGIVELPQTKTEPRLVILSHAAQEILREALATCQSVWVFPNPQGRPYSREQVSRVFRRSARQAGLRDFHFHDLRHHGATKALNAGFSPSIVMDLGGWKNAAMMRRYAAVTNRTLRAAAEAVSGRAPALEAEEAPGRS
jgi:integrase